MNIAIFTSSYLPVQGGMQYELYWLLKAIDKKFKSYGIKRFVFIVPKYEKQEYLPFNNIEVVEFDNPLRSKINYFSFIPHISRIYKEYKLDIINCWSATPDGFCCMGAKYLTGVPYIVTSHGADTALDPKFDYGLRRKKINAIITRKVLKNAKCVTTIGTDMVGYVEQAGASKDKIRIIPNGIEVEPELGVADTGDLIRDIKNKYSIDDSHTIFLTLAGMRKIKGHVNLVKAFGIALKQNPKMILFIGAHGLETENITNLVRSLGLEKNVHFIGFVTGEEKKAWFDITDVYCNTAYFEPFGIVYIEAIKNSIAVLGSIRGGGKDIFIHDKDAYIINPESIDEIKRGILMLADSEYRKRIIENSKRLLAKYDIEHIAGIYLDVFKKSLQN